MSNFGFFDLMSFLLPGGIFIAFVIYFNVFLGLNLTFLGSQTDIPAELDIILGISLAYFMGHIIRMLSDKISPQPIKAVDIIAKKEYNERVALDNLCKDWFNFSIFDNRAVGSPLSESLCSKFFDRVFNALDADDKIGKIRILQSQFHFFRNLTTTFVLLLCLYLIASAICLIREEYYASTPNAITLLAFLLIMPLLSMYVASYRRKKFLLSTFDLFKGWNDTLNKEKK